MFFYSCNADELIAPCNYRYFLNENSYYRGAGFIGSTVIRYLIQNTNDCVINVDKLTYAGNLDSLSTIEGNPRYVFECVDICDYNSLANVFRKHESDAIMHLAAENHVDRSIDGPGTFIQTNLVGTYTLLEVARSYWKQLNAKKQSIFRFHHISTDEVSHPEENPIAHKCLFSEKSSYLPSSPYSASKAGSDHLVHAWYYR